MDYRDLVLYQKACEVVKEVNIVIKTWPKSMQSLEISRQLFRASTSVGANIAEGHGRHKGQEYIHYLTIAQGSANEVDHWLNTVLDCRIASAEDIQDLIRLNNETRKMLTSAINSLQKKQSDKVLREVSSPYSPIPYSLENPEEDL
jgi:four helix bundle protein